MKFTVIEVRATTRKSVIPAAFYDIVNRGMDGILAPLDLLLKSASAPSAFLGWLDGDTRPESQQWTATYHFVEPLNSDPIETNEFLIRATKRQKDEGRMKINITLEGDARLSLVRLDFNGRFNTFFAGRCLFDLREYLTAQGIPWDTITLKAEGYIGESHTNETLLAAFDWDAEHGQMIHKRGEARKRR